MKRSARIFLDTLVVGALAFCCLVVPQLIAKAFP